MKEKFIRPFFKMIQVGFITFFDNFFLEHQ